MASFGRRSIARPATLDGRGLHTGLPARVTLRPGGLGDGITFRRVDRPGIPVRATTASVRQVERRTALGDGDSAISTVEHLLAATAAHAIDDLAVDVEGPEAPILDGSAAPYFS